MFSIIRLCLRISFLIQIKCMKLWITLCCAKTNHSL